MKKNKGFSLVGAIIIVVVTAIISGLTTGLIMYNSYKQSTGLSYTQISNDSALIDFLEVYGSIVNDYYEDVDRRALLEEAASAMMNYLGDSYTTYLNSDESSALSDKLAGEYKGIGVSIIGNIIASITPNSPAESVGLSIDDEIIKINDEDVRTYGAGQIAAMIKNTDVDSVKITILRDNQEKEYNVNLSTLYVPAISSDVIEENGRRIGYIYIGTFSNTLAAQVREQLAEFKNQKIDSLIIDVRDNTGGYLSAATDTANIFLEKGKLIYSLESKDDTKEYLDDTEEHQDYKMAVLINKNSASASEILAAALKDSYGAILVGEKSFGKGKVQQTLSLKDGSMVKYTSAKWLTPSGTCIDGEGLIPDYEVYNEYEYEDEEQTIITNITDNQLPLAIDIISK